MCSKKPVEEVHNLTQHNHNVNCLNFFVLIKHLTFSLTLTVFRFHPLYAFEVKQKPKAKRKLHRRTMHVCLDWIQTPVLLATTTTNVPQQLFTWKMTRSSNNEAFCITCSLAVRVYCIHEYFIIASVPCVPSFDSASNTNEYNKLVISILLLALSYIYFYHSSGSLH